MHKDACACQRDRAADQVVPLSGGFPPLLPSPLSEAEEDEQAPDRSFRLAHAGMSDGLTPAACRLVTFHPSSGGAAAIKPLKRDLGASDANNNRRNRDANAVPAKYQVLPRRWDAMNGNLHLEAADAGGVAMETNGRATCKSSLLNEQMLEQLNGMSLSERRCLPALTPRITLTSVDGDDEGTPDMMTDAAADYGLGPQPKFLTVPKLQEVGKERRPPVMVKTV